MIPTDLAAQRGAEKAARGSVALLPSRIAELCAGRVLRRGDPAGRPARRIVIDSRELEPGDCFVALPGANFDGHEFLSQVIQKGAAGVVVSRPVPRALLEIGRFVVRVDDTFAALLQIARAHRSAHDAKVIGITGSCGKTSTKDMLGEVLARGMPTVRSPKSYNNHVGVPLTLFRIDADTRVAVVEIGTNAPGEIERLAAVARPDIGIITRVDDCHLMRLGTREGVAREKSNLVAALSEDGLAILNGDDPSTAMMRDATRARVLEVRIDREADLFATDVSFHGLGTSFRLQGETLVTLPRLGSHNVYNALFTIGAATELGVPKEQILESLCTVGPSARRLECKQLGDISIIDDTYNSNPASSRVALLALSGVQTLGRRIVVFGEMLELGERSVELHEEIGAAVADSAVDVLITVGEGARSIAEAALRFGMATAAVHPVVDAAAAIEWLDTELRPGDWMLCKASRGVGLDRVVDSVVARLQARYPE